MKICETFKCSGQNSSNSLCQLWNDKSVPLQILCNSSLSWQITTLWILSSYFFNFGLKDPIKIPILSTLEKICHIPYVIFQTTSQLKLMLDKSVNNVLGEGIQFLDNCIPLNLNFGPEQFGLSTSCLKLSKFLIWFLKSGVSFV